MGIRDLKTDNKNIALARLVKQLRDSIDLDRLIGLNAKALKKSKISNALLGYIQSLAHGSIAVLVCKIYEDSRRNELDSIPAIIESLPAGRLMGKQRDEVIEFGVRYGSSAKLTDPKSHLRATLGLFMGIHSMAFAEMKKYRDKVGAHGESKAKITALPSHDEFEAFLSFAEDFYRVVSGAFIGVGPATIERRVGKGFFRLMQSMGIDEPMFDFKK